MTLKKRVLDVWSIIFMAGMGLSFLLPGDTLVAGFSRLLAYLPENGWAWLCIVIALTRLGALLINGAAAEGSPIVRTVGAILGATIWSMFAAAGLVTSVSRDALTIGAWTFLCFSGLDLHNAVRAAREAHESRRKRLDRAKLAH